MIARSVPRGEVTGTPGHDEGITASMIRSLRSLSLLALLSLAVTGCLLIFCQTQTWTSVPAPSPAHTSKK